MASHRQRTLVVMRHSKAEWPEVPDHERPLADRGRDDAAEAGRRLARAGIAPDLVVCSPATRTRETWRILAKELPRRPHTSYDDRVYEASVQNLLYLVQETADEVDTLMLLAHNPGAAGLVDTLAAGADGDALDRVREKYPTSGVAVLTFDGAWETLNEKAAHLREFLVPRD